MVKRFSRYRVVYRPCGDYIAQCRFMFLWWDLKESPYNKSPISFSSESLALSHIRQIECDIYTKKSKPVVVRTLVFKNGCIERVRNSDGGS